jgi:glutamate:GABA antiporter
MCGWAYWTTNMFYLPTLLFYLGGILAYAGPKSVAGLAENRVFFFLLTVGLLWLTALLNIRGIGVGKWVNNSGGLGTLIGCGGAGRPGRRGGLAARRRAARLQFRDSRPRLEHHVLVRRDLLRTRRPGTRPVMGDEIRDPQRSVPQGVLWGGILAGLVYVTATLALLLAVPQQEVKIVQGVLQAVDKMTAMGVGARWMLTALAAVLAVAIAGSSSAWLGGSARILFVSGIDRYMPRAMGKVHPKICDAAHRAYSP